MQGKRYVYAKLVYAPDRTHTHIYSVCVRIVVPGGFQALMSLQWKQKTASDMSATLKWNTCYLTKPTLQLRYQ